MTNLLTPAEKLRIISKFIGQKIWVRSLQGHLHNREPEHQFGILMGVKSNAVQVAIGKQLTWMHLDELPYYELKLLLKPLSKLTPEIMKTANELPVTVFITQYYTNLGFDMPVFLAPEHPGNCKYVHELGLADYRSEDEIIEMETSVVLR
ncbi:hypothetical protein GS399_03155 [Pedobacter sp. HMF7647]|uniref:Uncharacterized protein n=1 Tax=Hufsiella arboris TaxID=2695275 RepID=A0A7K1Y5V0_9SPHI|nr:hypothetical protein [Hufsiella arboris]MXV49956.1 hypothetical protein [Hufsiella arboris]